MDMEKRLLYYDLENKVALEKDKIAREIDNKLKYKAYFDYHSLGDFDDYFSVIVNPQTGININKHLKKHVTSKHLIQSDMCMVYPMVRSYETSGRMIFSRDPYSSLETDPKKEDKSKLYDNYDGLCEFDFEGDLIMVLKIENQAKRMMEMMLLSRDNMDVLFKFIDYINEEYSILSENDNNIVIYTNFRKGMIGGGATGMMALDADFGGYGQASYHMQTSDWKPSQRVRKRSFKSVYLNQELKTELVGDLDQFMSVETQEWYKFHDIPSKRCYLFYGPPGTGKTSTIKAIASKYGLGICILKLNIREMDDTVLINLIEQLPLKSVLVIEDVDSIFDNTGAKTEDGIKSNLSFSGLMNVLDGITGFSGQIVILTTNHKERLNLDSLRTGRIDYQLEFGHMDPIQTGEMLRSFYEEITEDKIDQLVGKIQKNVEIVPADLQEVIIRHRNDGFDYILENYEDIIHSIKVKSSSKMHSLYS